MRAVSQMTFTLEKGAGGWLIHGWTWTGPKASKAAPREVSRVSAFLPIITSCVRQPPGSRTLETETDGEDPEPCRSCSPRSRSLPAACSSSSPVRVRARPPAGGRAPVRDRHGRHGHGRRPRRRFLCLRQRRLAEGHADPAGQAELRRRQHPQRRDPAADRRADPGRRQGRAGRQRGDAGRSPTSTPASSTRPASRPRA